MLFGDVIHFLLAVCNYSIKMHNCKQNRALWVTDIDLPGSASAGQRNLCPFFVESCLEKAGDQWSRCVGWDRRELFGQVLRRAVFVSEPVPIYTQPDRSSYPQEQTCQVYTCQVIT